MTATWKDGTERRPVRCMGVADDGNVFAMLGRAARCLRKAGHAEDVKAMTDEATSGDYDHAVQTLMGYVEVDYSPNLYAEMAEAEDDPDR